MQVPNLADVVHQVYVSGTFDLTTPDGCGVFTEACAFALHARDHGFGLLRKTAAQTHVLDAAGNRHAVDAVLYNPTGQAIDLIADSASDAAAPAWIVDPVPRYGPMDWLAPEPPPVPSAAPAAPASTGQRVAIRLPDGVHFVTVDPNDGKVYTDRTAIGPWETFTLVPVD